MEPAFDVNLSVGFGLMRINVLIVTVFLTLNFLATPQTDQAPKDGEAQAVSFDSDSLLSMICGCSKVGL